MTQGDPRFRIAEQRIGQIESEIVVDQLRSFELPQETVRSEFARIRAVNPLVRRKRRGVQILREQRLKTRVRMLDHVERKLFDRRHRAVACAVVLLPARHENAVALVPLDETVGSAAD